MVRIALLLIRVWSRSWSLYREEATRLFFESIWITPAAPRAFLHSCLMKVFRSGPILFLGTAPEQVFLLIMMIPGSSAHWRILSRLLESATMAIPALRSSRLA